MFEAVSLRSLPLKQIRVEKDNFFNNFNVPVDIAFLQ